MRTLAAVIFPGFELLDLFGPLQMFSLLGDKVEIRLVAETLEPVAANRGPRSLPDDRFGDRDVYDLILLPGGFGTRREVANPAMLDWLRHHATAEIAASVCTGAAVFAAAGLLEGRRATTNKWAWQWATSHGDAVDWQTHARWVRDGNVYTASGVSAGLDMSLALIADLFGEDTASETANAAEYHWQRDPSYDPFADLRGL